VLNPQESFRYNQNSNINKNPDRKKVLKLRENADYYLSSQNIVNQYDINLRNSMPFRMKYSTNNINTKVDNHLSISGSSNLINKLPKSGVIKLKGTLEESSNKLKNIIEEKIFNTIKKIPKKINDHKINKNNLISFCSCNNLCKENLCNVLPNTFNY